MPTLVSTKPLIAFKCSTRSIHYKLNLTYVDPNLLLQQALQRKRELKGSYKAKLSLEKLIIEFEKKRLQVKKLRSKQYRLHK